MVLIVVVGGGYFYLTTGDGSCKRGQMQLSRDVKAFIDAELAKSRTQKPALAGLKELTAKLSAAEASLTELQNLSNVYTQSYFDFSKAVNTLAARRNRLQNDTNKWTETLRFSALRSCNKPKKAKKQ